MRTRAERESMAAHLEDVAHDLADISFELSGEAELPKLGGLVASGAAKMLYIAKELRSQPCIQAQATTEGGPHGEDQKA